ncbi:hypothetical protein [Actinacidiphila soli]|uniref:hypothetical protein n=1 Tax=Actinacidiphila soli TaxID=2487275 RepID=UPI000FCA095D|nr:hypothetical protein [Actinacidiphila soli]
MDELHLRQESPLAAGYWCEVIAYTPHDGRAFWLGSHPATTPRLALRWLHERGYHVADQLDPHAALPVHHWVTDQREHERALSHLAQGAMYAHTIFDDTTRYVLTARPTGTTLRQAP